MVSIKVANLMNRGLLGFFFTRYCKSSLYGQQRIGKQFVHKEQSMLI